MIDYETYVQIRNHLDRNKLNYNQVAEKLAIDHRTVARWAQEKRYQPPKELLEQRARPVQEPGALHLTRRSDLMDLTIIKPDLSIYNHSIKE